MRRIIVSRCIDKVEVRNSDYNVNAVNIEDVQHFDLRVSCS